MQVEQGLQLGLPTSVMVKLCTALSEHAAHVCRTGDCVMSPFVEAEEEKNYVQGGGSPLRGLSLQKAHLLQDKVLGQLDLGR